MDKDQAEKERNKRANRRERRRMEFEAQKQNARLVERHVFAYQSPQKEQKERKKAEETTRRLTNIPLREFTEASLRISIDVMDNKAAKPTPEARTKQEKNKAESNTEANVEWPKIVKLPERNTSAGDSPYWVQPGEAGNEVAAAVKDKPCKEMKYEDCAAKGLVQAWGTPQKKKISRQIDDDFLMAVSMQQKLDRGFDAAPPQNQNAVKKKAEEPLRKLLANKEVDDNQKVAKARKTDVIEKNKDNNKKNELSDKNDIVVEKMKEASENNLNMDRKAKEMNNKNTKCPSPTKAPVGSKSDDIILPNMPQDSITIEDLEKSGGGQNLKGTQSDSQLSKAVQPQENKIQKKPRPDTGRSGGDGPSLAASSPPQASDNKPVCEWVPWQRRSVRWGHLVENLMARPSSERERVGAMNFTFSDEKLFIAKGYDLSCFS